MGWLYEALSMKGLEGGRAKATPSITALVYTNIVIAKLLTAHGVTEAFQESLLGLR